MSNAEYVTNLDEDQLSNLIEKATARREEIRQSGWVKLWVVNIGWANVAWFAEDEHAAAVEHACTEVRKAAAKRPGHGISMEVSQERFRPNDAAELLGSRSAAVQAPESQAGEHAHGSDTGSD